MTAAQLIEPRQGTSAEVEAWRLHVLLQAGYPLKLAERIACTTADLHQAVQILERGCAPQTAAQILT
ncbi:MAG TPA: hypothetical protein VGC71_07325 [Gaiellales bacterium]|jgi:hypothetical protein